jgi:hypothetical protein
LALILSPAQPPFLNAVEVPAATDKKFFGRVIQLQRAA